jgi:pimeloyl-ACP methyl ester carboxylesterase
MSTKQQFAALQQQWLEKSGSFATSHYLLFKEFNKNIHILEAGQGEPLLLLHGGNAFSALWEPLLTQLKSDFHLVAPDRFNCGLSDVIRYKEIDLYQHAISFLDALFDHYRWSSVSVMGNSLGGYWAMIYALARPERIKKIILIGTPGGTQAPPRILCLSSIPFFNEILFYFLMRGKNSTEDLFKRALVADIQHLPKAIFPLMDCGLRLPGAQRAWLDILEMTCTTTDLQQISQETLLLWGDKDVFGSVKQAKTVANALPNAKLDIISNSGHMPWLDQGEKCAQLIREFI